MLSLSTSRQSITKTEVSRKYAAQEELNSYSEQGLMLISYPEGSRLAAYKHSWQQREFPFESPVRFLFPEQAIRATNKRTTNINTSRFIKMKRNSTYLNIHHNL